MTNAIADMLAYTVGAIEKRAADIPTFAEFFVRTGQLHYVARISGQLALIPNAGADLSARWCDAVEKAEDAKG